MTSAPDTLLVAPRFVGLTEADVVPPVAALRVGAIGGLPAVLAEFGLALDSILVESDLRTDLFRNPEDLITYPQLERLLLCCEQRSGCDCVGLLVGQRSRLADMGLTGQVAACETTAGGALRSFIDFYNLHDTAATVALLESDGYARFVYTVSGHGLVDTRHFQSGGITIAFNILQDLFGREWRPVAVRIASRAPASERPFQAYFRVPVEFNADESAVIFARHWLDRPFRAVHERMRHELQAVARARQTRLPVDFPATVRRILRKQLLIGSFSMADVASRMSMHRRTLDRQLQRHGLTFGESLDAVRSEVACQLLRDTSLPIQEIADSVRFSSPASFATAFRRHMGMTPSAYRRRQTSRHLDDVFFAKARDRARP